MGVRLNILLVENDAVLYRHTANILKMEGYHIVQPADGSIVDSYAKAVELLSTVPINLAILDIELEGEETGLDIGHFISERFPKLPFLFLSNYSNVENFLQAGKTGAADFLDKLEKPFTDNQLKRKLLLLRDKMQAATVQEKEAAVFNVQLFVAGSTQEEQGFYKKIIKWSDVISITSYDPQSNYTKKNNFFFYLSDQKTYRVHEPLKMVDELLPDYITRFNDQEIVNIFCLDGKGKSDNIYLINGKRFRINPENQEKALRAIHLFLHPNF